MHHDGALDHARNSWALSEPTVVPGMLCVHVRATDHYLPERVKGPRSSAR